MVCSSSAKDKTENIGKVSGKNTLFYCSWLCVFLIFDMVVNFYKNENGKELFHVFLPITILFFLFKLISSTFIFLLPQLPSTNPNNLPCVLVSGVVIEKFDYITIFFW